MRCDDLRAGARGPRFAGQAAELGVLSLYAADPAAFGSDSESTGVLLASHAALAIAAARTEAGLLAALDSREMIGQAKGTLMERCKITGVQAFGLLVDSFQAVNRRLREVAEQLVAIGELLGPSG